MERTSVEVYEVNFMVAGGLGMLKRLNERRGGECEGGGTKGIYSIGLGGFHSAYVRSVERERERGWFVVRFTLVKRCEMYSN